VSAFYQNLINQAKMKAARIAGGSYTFTITRPNYSALDSSTIRGVAAGQFYIEPSNGLLSEDRIPGVNYYIITGNRNLFQSGDVITCSSTDIPTVTVAQDPDEQEPLAIKTPKTCTLNRNGTNTFLNVPFDYINVGGYKGTADIGPNIPQALETMDRQIVIYTRPNLREDDTFVDNATTVPYSVIKIDYVGALALLTLASPSQG